MQTYLKKRIDITVEAPLLGRVISLLESAQVGGYTALPALAGRGQSGAWDRDGQVGRTGSMVVVFTIVDESRVEAILEPLFKLVSRQIGIVTVSDVQVIRPGHF